MSLQVCERERDVCVIDLKIVIDIICVRVIVIRHTERLNYKISAMQNKVGFSCERSDKPKASPILFIAWLFSPILGTRSWSARLASEYGQRRAVPSTHTRTQAVNFVRTNI